MTEQTKSGGRPKRDRYRIWLYGLMMFVGCAVLWGEVIGFILGKPMIVGLAGMIGGAFILSALAAITFVFDFVLPDISS